MPNDKLVQSIRKLILAGELQDKILQKELANRLKVSRTPVVNALESLCGQGLVENIPNQGYYVRAFKPGEFLELMQFRKIMEASICYELCPVLNKAQLESLAAIFQPYERLVSDQWDAAVQDSYREADIVFHDTLLQYCDNTLLRRIDHDIQFLNRTYLKGLLRPAWETLPEHLSIIEALSQRNRVEAMEAMYAHLGKSVEIMDRSLKIYQEFDKIFR